MNSKNLSKAINRMLAFLLSVAMIATSSFVTPVFADDADVEGIEVVNEIGSEDTSDTVMTTDDSTDDIIVENLEEGGEELSDDYVGGNPDVPVGIIITLPADLDGSSINYDTVAKSAATYYASTEITTSDGKIDLRSAAAGYHLGTDIDYYLEVFDPDQTDPELAWDKVSDVTQVVEDTPAGGTATDAGKYRFVVDVHTTDGKYEAKKSAEFTIKKIDISTLADARFAIDWSNRTTKVNGGDNDGQPKYLKDESVGNITIPKVTVSKWITGLSEDSTTAKLTAANDKIEITAVPVTAATDDMSLENATPGQKDAVKANMPKIKVKILDDDNFTGEKEIPFIIWKADAESNCAVADTARTVRAGDSNKTVNISELFTVDSSDPLEYYEIDEKAEIKDDAAYKLLVANLFASAPTVKKNGNDWVLSYSIKSDSPQIVSSYGDLTILAKFKNYADQEVKITFSLDETVAANELKITWADENEYTKAYDGSGFTAGKVAATLALKTSGAPYTFDLKKTKVTAYKIVGSREIKGATVTGASTDADLTAVIDKVTIDVKDAGTYRLEVVYEDTDFYFAGSHQLTITGKPTFSVAKGAGYTIPKYRYSEDGVSIDADDITVSDGTALEKDKDYTVECFVNDHAYSVADDWALTADEVDTAAGNELGTTADPTSDEDDLEMSETAAARYVSPRKRLTASTVAGNKYLHKNQPYAVITGIGNYDGATATIGYEIAKNKTALNVEDYGITGAGTETQTMAATITPGAGSREIDISKLFIEEGTTGLDDGPYYVIPTSLSDVTVSKTGVTYDIIDKTKGVTIGANGKLNFNSLGKVNAGDSFKITFTPKFANYDGFTRTVGGNSVAGTIIEMTVTVKAEYSIAVTNTNDYTYNGTANGPTAIVNDSEGEKVASATPTGTYYDKLTTAQIKDLTAGWEDDEDYIKISDTEIYYKNQAATTTAPTNAGSYLVKFAYAAQAGSLAAESDNVIFEIKPFVFSDDNIVETTKGLIASPGTLSVGCAKDEANDIKGNVSVKFKLIPNTADTTITSSTASASKITYTITTSRDATKGGYTKTLKITGDDDGNYKGSSASIDYYFAPLDLTDLDTTDTNVTVDLWTSKMTEKSNGAGTAADPKWFYTYDGKQKTPGVKKVVVKAAKFSNVSAADTTVPSSMYDVEWGENIHAGTSTDYNSGTVKVIFKGDYKGSYTQKFAIKPVAAAADTFKNEERLINVVEGDGTYLLPEIILDKDNNEIPILTYETTYAASGDDKILVLDDSKGIVDIRTTGKTPAVSGTNLSYTIKSTAVAGDTATIKVPIATVKDYTIAGANRGYILVKLTVVSKDKKATIAWEGTQATNIEFYGKNIELSSDFEKAIITPDGGTALTAAQSSKYIKYTWYKKNADNTTYSPMPADEEIPVHAGSYRVVAEIKDDSYVANQLTANITIAPVALVDGNATTAGAADVPITFVAGTQSVEVNGDEPLDYKDAKWEPAIRIGSKLGTDREVTWLKLGEDYTVTYGTGNKTVAEACEYKITLKNSDYTLATAGSSKYVKINPATITIKFPALRMPVSASLPASAELSTYNPSAAISYSGTVADHYIDQAELDKFLRNDVSLFSDYECDTAAVTDDVNKRNEIFYNVATTGFTLKVYSTSDKATSKTDLAANYDTTITYVPGTVTVQGENDPTYEVWFYEYGNVAYSIGAKEGALVEDPEDGDVLAWYKDAALTKQWNFAKDVVNKDSCSVIDGVYVLSLYAGMKNYEIDEEMLPAGVEISAIDPQIYTGKKITPTVVVKKNGVLLKKGKDYKLDVKGAGTDVGTYSLNVIFGKDAPIPVTYSILPVDLEYANVVVKTIGQTVVSKAGKYTPISSVKVNGRTLNIKKGEFTYALEKYDDSTESWDLYPTADASVRTAYTKEALEPGTYRAVIYGKDETNYVGATLSDEFYITEKAMLLKNAKIKMNASSMDCVIDNTGKALYTNPGFTFTVGNDTYTYTPTGSDAFEGANFGTFTGANAEKGNACFGVTIANCVGQGKATITVEGIGGGYVGTKTQTYTIKPVGSIAMNNDVKKTIGKLTNINFTGEAYTFDEVLAALNASTTPNGTYSLDSCGMGNYLYGRDFYILYKKNVDAGTASMTFMAAPGSAYKGKFSVSFKIKAVPIDLALRSGFNTTTGEGDTISLNNVADYDANVADNTYNSYNLKWDGAVAKNGKKAKISGILFKNSTTGNALVEGVDYSVTYKDFTATSAKAVIKGKGSYAGKNTLEITFNPATAQ